MGCRRVTSPLPIILHTVVISYQNCYYQNAATATVLLDAFLECLLRECPLSTPARLIWRGSGLAVVASE